MSIRLVTWNVNSVRKRIDALARLIDDVAPDVLCLQETKVVDQDFPAPALRERGYAHVLLRGMKSYNGVAIFSRLPFRRSESRQWCKRDDCRHVMAELPGGIELHNFYVPAGGDVADPKVNDKFAHKLRFVEEMTRWCRSDAGPKNKAILVGDLNIAPLETDVWSHVQLLDVVSHTPAETTRLEKLRDSLGWVDAVRHFIPPTERLYSWWSYRAHDWEASDRGRRLDHVWVTPALAPALKQARILRAARGWDDPSDHVPVIVDLA